MAVQESIINGAISHAFWNSDNASGLPYCNRIRFGFTCALVGHGAEGSQSSPVSSPETARPSSRLSDRQQGAFSLSDHWELEQDYKRGIFTFRPHRSNYLIATYTHRPNDAPYRPFRQLTSPSATLSHVELAFQLGFKMKLIENIAGQPADLWFGYTQNSYWQADNQEASSPFRETNYQPELMTVLPLNFSILGLNARFINFGLVHQSNGQASTISRSWNRLYAQWAWSAATSQLCMEITGTSFRRWLDTISILVEARCSSVGHFRWPAMLRGTCRCFPAMGKV